MTDTEQELKEAIQEPFDDGELDELQRKLVDFSVQLIIPLREVDRSQYREIGGILAALGQDMVMDSHEKRGLVDVLFAGEKRIRFAREQLLVYRNRAQKQANERSNAK